MKPKTVKKICKVMFSLLVNVVIVFCIVKLFSYSFNFTYDVFGKVALDPASTKYVVVTIPADSSTSEICDILVDAKLCDSKYVLMAKMKLGGYGGKVIAGKYGLSASMTYDEILTIISNSDVEEEEE